MVQITLENDLQFYLANATGIVGQQPYKKDIKLDTIGDWQLTDKLDGLKEFTFTVKNDEVEKTNVLVERNINVPFLTPFSGMIVEKTPAKDVVQFKAVENAWHLTRRKFRCHDKRRIKYTDNSWHDKLWRFRRHIKILGKKLHDLSTGNDLVNFPLLFHTIDEELKTHARSDGFDIFFTKTETDGTTTKLHHDIEYYDSTTGELWVWVEYPEIRSGQDEDFEMYFGYEEATDQSNPTGTWDDYLNGYAMVQHLHENSLDSTSNNNDGTDTSITYVPGKIANTAQFDAVDSKIDFGSGTSIDDIWTATNGAWFTCWFNPNSDGEGNEGKLITKGDDATSGWHIELNSENAGYAKIHFNQHFSSTHGEWETTNAVIPLNKNTRIDIQYDASDVANNPIFYINSIAYTVGNGLTEITTPSGTAQTDAAINLVLGNLPDQSRTFDGEIEEVRILKSPPANLSELIKIEYANELDPDNYFVIGQAEEYIQQADIIADAIIRSANRDMPVLNTTPISNLVSLWRFDGDTNDSKGSSNGTWSGNSLYVKGFFNTDATNKTAKFEGSSRIATTDTPFPKDKDEAFSLDFKIKTSTVTESILISKRTDLTSSSAGYSVNLNTSGIPIFEVCNGTSEWSVTGTKSINDGYWHTIAVTFAGNENQDGMKIYIDGKLNATGATSTITGSLLNGLNLTFGAGSAGASAYTGVLDDIRFYDKELTDKECARLHTMSQSDIDIVQSKNQWKLGDGHVTEIDNLISLWKFDQNLNDTKRTNHGVDKGITPTYVTGKYNSALDFNGTDSIVYVTPDTSLDNVFASGGSISCWIYTRTDGEGSVGKIIDKRGGTTNGWSLNVQNDDATNFRLNFEQEFSTTKGAWQTEIDIPLNTWIHVVVTYDYDDVANNPKFYINGVERNSTVITETSTPVGTANSDVGIPLIIGNIEDGSNTFDGLLEEVRLYSDILIGAEPKRIYEATSSALDRFRDDDIPTRLLEVDFNHKNHLESLKKVAKELGVNIYFDSNNYRVFIKTKGKNIAPIFDKSDVSKPNFSLKNVANVVNVIGHKNQDENQLEKTFEDTNELKYNYEQTFTDNLIATDDTLNLVGAQVVDQLKSLEPDLSITTTPDQYNRFDIQVGDTLNISELKQDLQGIFKIISITLTNSKVKIDLSKKTNTTIQTAGNSIGDFISGLSKQIQDITIVPE